MNSMRPNRFSIAILATTCCLLSFPWVLVAQESVEIAKPIKVVFSDAKPNVVTAGGSLSSETLRTTIESSFEGTVESLTGVLQEFGDKEKVSPPRVAFEMIGNRGSIQDQASPSDNNRSESNSTPTRQDRNDTPIDELLPTVDLNAGISLNSFQRTLARREIGDLNQSFLASAQYAPAYYTYEPQMFWKTWTSPNMLHRPLYFEEPNLERYGIHRRWQPVVSGTHFVLNVATLPYQIGAQCPDCCEYSLGRFRPGNCTPAYRHSANVSAKGGIAQALTVGLILAGLGL
jgi:hypothetical protein